MTKVKLPSVNRTPDKIDTDRLKESIQENGYIHTYIGGRGGYGDIIHEACVALEATGFIKREIDEKYHVYWVLMGATKEARGDKG